MSNAVETRKPRNPQVSKMVFVQALVAANGTQTPKQLADKLGMEVTSFNQRLMAMRKEFKDDAELREQFANDLKGPDGTVLDYPAFLSPADARRTENGGGGHREKGLTLRAALAAALKKSVEAAAAAEAPADSAVEEIVEI